MRVAVIIRALFILFILPLVVHPVTAAEITIVSPRGLENMDGNNRGSGTINPFRIQYLYPASDFAALSGADHLLVGFAQRADTSQPVPATVDFPDIRIVVSITTATRLSSVFANNLPPDSTVVFDGSTGFSLVTGPPGGPNPFGTAFRFQSPFMYKPELGNLLVDITSSAGANSNPWLDFHPTDGPTLVLSSDPTARAGDPSNFLQVRQFIFDSMLLPGDADQDLDFDQLDLVQVQIAAKYLSGHPATWGEGDWNTTSVGTPGNPPLGDGLFNQVDIVAALNASIYLTGPYASLAGGGPLGNVDLVHVPEPPSIAMIGIAMIVVIPFQIPFRRGFILTAAIDD